MTNTSIVSLHRRRLGSGEPLVLVHGTACDGASFSLLEPLLADRFTVVTVDRRGRGKSPDAGDYAFEAEFDDLVAVVDESREPVVLFGHSFGANVALGAALRTDNVRALVLYEPGRPDDVRTEVRHEIADLIARDERRAAMRLALREFTVFPEEWLDDLLATPPWEERLAYAHTIPRELDAYETFDYGDLSGLVVPTLLLVGSESPAEDHAFARSLESRLPSARVSVLFGESHIAATTAPSLLAAEIIGFVRSLSSKSVAV